MELLKILLGINLILINVNTVTSNDMHYAAVCNAKKSNLHLIRYDVDLKLYIDKLMNLHDNEYFKSYVEKQEANGNFVFYGESNIFFQPVGVEKVIRLYFLNLKINEPEIKVTYGSRIEKVIMPVTFTYNVECQSFEIYFDEPFLPETYRLTVKFVGSINDEAGGFVRKSYTNRKGEKAWIITAADFRGTGIRQIFPCWGHPFIKTNFTISITHPLYYIALSNAPIERALYDSDNNMIRSNFQTTDNISPDNVAIVVFDFERISDTGKMWCRQSVKQQLEFAQKVAEDTIEYLIEKLYNAKIPPDVEYAAIPDFQDEGMESWGIVLYRETAIIYNKTLDSVAWKFEVTRTVARKIVYQFFGNLVGQSWWSYLWFNEGIATYLTMRFVQIIHPQLMDLLVVQFQHESLYLNDYYNMSLVREVNSLSDINSLFSFIHYVKAPIFVRSLLDVISKEAFEIGLNNYLTKYQLQPIDTSSSTIDNFFNVLQKEVIHESDVDLKINLGYWTKLEHYPILQVTRNFSKNEVQISLSPKNLNEAYLNELWICVSYTTQSAPDITKKRWLKPQNVLSLTDIPKYDWIIVNVQQAGYYRVNYNDDNWQKLIQHLNLAENIDIHVLNRAQIIDDAYYFLSKYKFDFEFFKSLTYYLSNETDYIAWYPMFKIMERVSRFFPFLKSANVKEHFREILENVLRKIGYIDRGVTENDFIKCLRLEAVKWACILNSLECTAIANSNLILHHKSSTPILPGWKEWTYCKGLMLADDIFWNKMFNLKDTKVLDNTFLEYLACPKNHNIIIIYLRRLNEGYFTEQQHIIIFHTIIARHAKNDLVFNYILTNLKYIMPKKMKRFVALVDIINHVYTTEQLSKVNNYASDHDYVFSSNYMFGYINKKIGQRLREIRTHVNYFSFLK
ncbi:aminopeptidase N [Monomorium pharaonis]|uniref:aminopeptidase N n=1 Tax=Monomorium pharaonis TaxID=307658 RepID=UPI00102E1375|nr:aminopeptidase N [Monomorium pharaonis]